jgi:hypothetical protein
MTSEELIQEYGFIRAVDSEYHEGCGCYIITGRHVNDELEIQKYQVMFGYRLRAGYLPDMEESGSELDICCGANELAYNMMFDMVTNIMLANVKSKLDPFTNIPRFSKIKPYWKDAEFLIKMNNLNINAVNTLGLVKTGS